MLKVEANVDKHNQYALDSLSLSHSMTIFASFFQNIIIKVLFTVRYTKRQITALTFF